MKKTMRAADLLTILLFLSFITQSTYSHSQNEGQNRRILHQPLFPDSSTPPPPQQQQPPSGPDTLNPDQPFFHELPNRPTPDQAQQPSPSTNTTPAENSAASRSSNATMKVAIAIASGILALALVLALAFYLYRHCSKHQDEARKPFSPHSRTTNQESRMSQPTFLYIGTVEPSARSVASETNAANGSPYQKLNQGKRSERYRPSPDLQPLPPLPKPAAAAAISSPTPMSSSDDESHDTNFYTPQGSSKSRESPDSRYTYVNNPISQINQANGNRQENQGRVPHSKRTSPKSRLFAPSLDTKPVIITSIKQTPPEATATSLGQLLPSKLVTYNPKRLKFAGPPPPPDMARLQLISTDDQPARKIPPPPPPPPPAVVAQPSAPKKFKSVEPCTPSPVSNKVMRPESMTPSSNGSSGIENIISPSADGNKGNVSSSRKADSEDKNGSRPKLKPLHWDKVRATSERATVWDQLKSSSFQLNEDAMESLFGCNSANSVLKEAASRKSALPASGQENRVLDPKKSQNIAILIRALNVTIEGVSEALLDGNPGELGPELLETLVKMAPTKEEEIKLKDYDGDVTKLGAAERFLKGILDIPCAFKRVDTMLYRANFDTEVLYLRNSFQTLEEASEELKNSRLFLKLLEAVLRTGNRMNDGTSRGDARAFKLDTLLKLVDVKGADGKTTLLHFVVQEIIRSEGATHNPPNETPTNKTNFKFKEEEFRKQGLQVVSGLSKELVSVKKAAGMDADVLSGYLSKLEMGLDKVRSIMQYERQGLQGKFFDTMRDFLKEASGEISRIKSEEIKALSHVKEVTEYFHGDVAKEAHPLRIFLIVRDFLGILDNVCKDVGRMQTGATMGAGRSFRMSANASFPVLSRYGGHHERDSNDD